jgi:UDP-glucose 4-epimerase
MGPARLPYTIVRPCNCVGIGEQRALGTVKLAMSHVVPYLVQKVLKGQDPLHVLGDGQQVRHDTYAGDLARGIVIAMEHPSAANEDFNLSTMQSTTVTELAAAIWRHINGERPLALVHDEPFGHEAQWRVPDVDKARRVLGFEATTTLADMLDEVIPWMENAAACGLL